jgi:hypothetical protein
MHLHFLDVLLIENLTSDKFHVYMELKVYVYLTIQCVSNTIFLQK